MRNDILKNPNDNLYKLCNRIRSALRECTHLEEPNRSLESGHILACNHKCHLIIAREEV